MKKIVFLPLDERPCNYQFPYKLFNQTKFNIFRPDLSLMGDKKQAGDVEALANFLLKETKDAYGLVIAIDTLLYGGIVPSRLHHDSVETLMERLHVLKQIRDQNPEIKIYAYHLIMRCPQYSLSDEEPDYYDEVGKEIFQYGYFNHKKELGIATQEELEKLNNIHIKEEYLNDFVGRRKINAQLTRASVAFVNEGIIDFLVIPQDDAAEFGWTALDQQLVRQDIETMNLQTQVYMYPGADEVANVLFSRLLCKVTGKRPLLHLKYNSITAPQTIPSLEDRYLDTTIKYQVLAAGGLIASSVLEADAVLFINAPSDQMITAPYQMELKGRGFTVNRNMVEFIEYMNYCIHQLKKPAIVADVAFGNGGDVEFVRLLEEKQLLMKVAAYAGWNTSANTLGTCIAQGIIYTILGETPNHLTFLAERYVEDIGYCAVVRRQISEKYLEPNQMNYFDVKEANGIIAQLVKEHLQQFVASNLPSLKDQLIWHEVRMPWRRMYEVGLTLEYVKES